MAKITEEQKQASLANAQETLSRRQSSRTGRNTFSEWGNDKCISRTQDTIRDMNSGNASDRQYQYWLNH